MSENQTSKWDDKLEIPGHVRFIDGVGDMPAINVGTGASSAEIYLQGAQLTHFQVKGQPPLLFLSQVSRFAEGYPIRGGIPIILPWFGPRPGHPSHGFARLRPWTLKETNYGADRSVSLRFLLEAESKEAGFAPFVAEYQVTVSDQLRLGLKVTNGSREVDLKCELCLHTYLFVGDINVVTLSGLKGTRYLDKVDAGKVKTEESDAIRIFSEVDRVYLDTAAPVEIQDPSLGRIIRVEKENALSTVVWNPWIAKAQSLPDFGNEEYLTMVCVESGNVAENALTLAPGASATMSVVLTARS
jgi:D-hexose-6-phosphate mutarotase